MTTLDSSLIPKIRSLFNNATERPNIKAIKALEEYLEENFPNRPQDLVSFFPKYPSLAKLAELIHDIFEMSSEFPIQHAAAALCEKGIRHLFKELFSQAETTRKTTESLKRAKKAVDYSILVAQNPDDIKLVKLQALELQRENQELNHDLDECREDIRRLQEENDLLNDRLQEKERKLNMQTISHNDYIAKTNTELLKKDDLFLIKTSREKFDAEEIERLSNRIKIVDEEKSDAMNMIDTLEEKLKKKIKIVGELQNSLKEKDTQIARLKEEASYIESNFKMNFSDSYRVLEDKNRQLTNKISVLTKEKDEKIEMLEKLNSEATVFIQNQNSTIAKYSEEKEDLEYKIDNLENQYNESLENNKNAEDELQSVSQSLEASLTELKTYKSIVETSCSNLAPSYVVTPDNLPAICKELSSTRIDPVTAKVLQRLNSIANGLCLFLVELIKNGTPRIEFLSQNPIKIPKHLQDELLNDIGEIQLFLETTAFQGAEEDKITSYLAGLSNSYDFEMESDGSLSAVLTSILVRFRKYYTDLIDELRKVRDVIPAFTCYDNELPGAIVKYIEQLKPVFDTLRNVIESTLHYPGDMNDIFDCLCKFVSDSSGILKSLDTEVRPLINYNGDIVDIVPQVVEIIKEYSQLANDLEELKQRDFSDKIVEFDRERVKYEREIDELMEKQKKSESLIQSISSKLSKLTANYQDAINKIEDQTNLLTEANNTNERIKMQSQVARKELDLLKQQNERLEVGLRDRKEVLEKRLKEAVEKERSIAIYHENIYKARLEEQQNILKERILSLNRKLTEQKEEMSRVADLYNRQSEEYQNNLRILNQRNSELNSSASNTNLYVEKQSNIEDLQKELSHSKQKINELNAEITRLSWSNSFSEPYNSLTKSPKRQGVGSNSKEITLRNSNSSDDIQFVEQISEILKSCFDGEVKWTKPRVLKTIENLVQEHCNLKSHKPKEIQNEWKCWAERLIQVIKPRASNPLSDLELRQQIYDIAIASGKRTKLVNMIQILRDEKSIIQNGQISPNTQGSCNMTSLIIFTTFLTLISKPKSDQSRFIVTPPSPSAVKATISLLK